MSIYTPDTDTWVELQTPTKGHGMLSLNGKLTLVGGVMKDSKNILVSFEFGMVIPSSGQSPIHQCQWDGQIQAVPATSTT